MLEYQIARRSMLVAWIFLLSSAGTASAGEPFRLNDHLGLPDALSVSAQHRIRYEHLEDQFRTGRKGDDQILAVRTLLHVRLDLTDRLTAGVEIMDSRIYLEDSFTPVSSAHANAVELLQAYGSFSSQWPEGGASTLRFGRITLDVGSRRLVARNRFRNTLNAFTGLDWQWKGKSGRGFRAFYTLPIQRRPGDVQSLRENQVEFDKESFDVNFWGFHHDRDLPWGDRGEVFVFGLHERDAPDRPTSNRQIVTPGFRIVRKARLDAFDYQVETALQFGKSHSSKSSAENLDHFAYFHHFEFGYTFDLPLSPRLVAQYDYASGDKKPNDGKNGRFNTLFGARRFDFGPTGIYGPFARSNINTPGVRLQLQPTQGVTAFFAYRAYWLASKKDTWTTSGVRDASGDSGSFVGSQLEMRLRWDVVPGNVRLETGAAHLFAGKFADDAPNGNDQGDATYVYTQLVFSL